MGNAIEIIWEGVTTKYGQTVFRVCRKENSFAEKGNEYDLSFFCKNIDAFGTVYWEELYEGDKDAHYIKYLKYYLVSVVLPIAREVIP